MIALAQRLVHCFRHNYMKMPAHRSLWLILVLAVFAASAQTVPSPSPETRWEIPATNDGLPGAGPIRRYDWFRKLWSERRAAWGQRLQQDRHALVFLGDSITQGWGDDMGGSFDGVKVANRGISGDTTRGVLIRMDDDVIALDPTGVVHPDRHQRLGGGRRPGNHRRKPKTHRGQSSRRTIQKCRSSCARSFPSSESKKRPAAKIKKLNQLYAAAVRGDAQVILLETWPLFANEQGDAKPEEFPDLLHPNKIGYAKWAAAIHPYPGNARFCGNGGGRLQTGAGL
jgi:hypothetical protein